MPCDTIVNITDATWYGHPSLRSVVPFGGDLYASSISPKNANFFFGGAVMCGGAPILVEAVAPIPEEPEEIETELGEHLWYGSTTIFGNQVLWGGLVLQLGPDSGTGTTPSIDTVFENTARTFWNGSVILQSIINPSLNLWYGATIFPGGIQLSLPASEFPDIPKFIPAFNDIDTDLNPHDPTARTVNVDNNNSRILISRSGLPFDPNVYIYGDIYNYKTARVFIELTRNVVFDSILAGKLTTKEPENVPFGSNVIWVALTEQTIDSGLNQLMSANGIKNPFLEDNIAQIYEDDFNRDETLDLGTEVDIGSPSPEFGLPWWQVGNQLGYDNNYDVGITKDGYLNDGMAYHPSSGTSPETKGIARWAPSIADDDYRVSVKIRGPIDALAEYGLIVRFIDKNNYYRVYTSNLQLILERVFSGVSTILAYSDSSELSGLVDPVLGLEVLNDEMAGSPASINTLTVYVNDVKINNMFDIQDGVLNTSSDRAGFTVDGILARVDDWRIITIPDNPVLFPTFEHLLGEGEPEWDFSGVQPPDVSANELINEVYRKDVDSVMLVRREDKIIDTVISRKQFTDITLMEIYSEEDLVGLTIFMDSGNNIYEQRIISAFDPATGKITVSNFFQKDLSVSDTYHFFRPVEDGRIATHAEFKTVFTSEEVNADIREQAILDPTGGCSETTDQVLAYITHEILSKSNSAIELVSRIRIQINHELS